MNFLFRQVKLDVTKDGILKIIHFELDGELVRNYRWFALFTVSLTTRFMDQ